MDTSVINITALMNFLKRVFKPLGRHITVLIVPHTDLPLCRFRFTLNFMLFGAALWSGVTIFAGYLIGRNIDYWVTKADNQVMRSKMEYLVAEIDHAREDLRKVTDADKQMRILLGMRTKQAIVENDEGIGGPNAVERRGLLEAFQKDPMHLSPLVIRANILALRQASAKRLASFQEIQWYINTRRSLYRSTPMGWPTEGRITSVFGYRFSPVNRNDDGESSEFHSGVDIANSADTPILATADGVVRYAGWRGGYGRMILLEHQWGYSTLYGHTSKVLAHVGETIRRGQMLAYMGTTGRSTGDHLHYEVWRHGRPVNPIHYLKPGSTDEILGK